MNISLRETGKSIWKIAVAIIAALWQLPQNLVGLFLLFSLTITRKIRKIEFERKHCFISTEIAISLGYFLFWTGGDENEPSKNSLVIKEHEYGHSIQSMLLGPLYLIVVGIPSVSRAIYAMQFYRKHRTPWTHYFDAFPENWANRLAKIETNQKIRPTEHTFHES